MALKYFPAAVLIYGIAILAASAGTTNTVPFSDDFESFAEGTPLIDGTNGWYASSSLVIVQTNVVYSGTNAAMIPPDTYLSNRFVTVSSSNVWVSMRVQPCLTLTPDAELTTNSTALFFVNTNGYCVVYNGTGGWTEIATKIDGSAAAQIATSQWGRFDFRINLNDRTWALFSDYQPLMTNIAFANTNCSSFSGFHVHNPGPVAYPEETNYLDNVAVSYLSPSDLTSQTGNWWNPVLDIDITNVSRTIQYGQTAASNSVHIWKSSGYMNLLFTNTILYTNCGVYTNWLSVTPATDTSHGELKTAWLVFNTASLPVSNQPYRATLRIDGTDDQQLGITASNSPRSVSVSVSVQSAPNLRVSPLGLTNSVTAGYRPSAQQITVANTSPPPRATMAYTVSSGTNWISVSSGSGSVVDDTNTISFTYLTENLAPGWHTGIVTVTSVDVATQQVSVLMRVNSYPILSWNAPQQTWTNIMTEGETLANTTFDIWNGSANPTGTMRFTVSTDSDWLSASPASGTNSGDRRAISAVYSISNLSPGVYTGTLTVAAVDDSTSGTASNSPLAIVASLTIRGRATLVVDIDSLTNSILENCGATNTAAFNIWNGAGTPRGGLTYSVVSYQDWLRMSPTSGMITNETNAVSVVWTTGSRAPGVYTGSIIVDGTDELTGSRATGAPKTINVQMTVLSRTPVNYEVPSIYGTPFIGQTLSARNGLWQNMDRLTFSYQWQRAYDSAGAGLVNLSGETASNYVVLVADRGKYMRIAVTATDANPTPRSATAYSTLSATAKIKAVPGDFNGDGIADLWFFDSSGGMWRASFAGNSFAEGRFGSAGMTAVPGDYNGDGFLDLGLYDSAYGMWYILYLPWGPSLSGSMFGGLTEETQATPVPKDYDGDGQTDVALYWRGYWAILYSTLGRIMIVEPIAGADGTPAPDDYDGDGIADLGVYDSGLWTIRNVLGQEWSVPFGSAAWIPAPGDYDGDSIADLGIFSQTSNTWSMIYSSTDTTNSRSFGSSLGANLPSQGYYDHDRYCDPATIHYSANGDFLIWCVTRTTDTNFLYRGQTYQKSIDDWRVSW